jgi:hypothetical protein
MSYSARRSLVSDSHQFIEEFLVVVADAEDVLLILLPSRSRIDSIRPGPPHRRGLEQIDLCVVVEQQLNDFFGRFGHAPTES